MTAAASTEKYFFALLLRSDEGQEDQEYRQHPYSSVESTTARCCGVGTNSTWRIPNTPRSFSAGTFMGPGEGAAPGAGCGKAVDIAVRNLTLPSTFCMVWWMCPLRTVTDPKRFTRLSACSLSCVPQPHSG